MAIVLSRHGGGSALNLFERELSFRSAKRRKLGGVHLEADRRITSQPATAVRENQQLRQLFDQDPDGFEKLGGDHTRLRQIDLIHENHRVHFRGNARHAIDETALQQRRSRRPVLAVEPVQFHRSFTRLHDQWLAIREGAAQIGFDEVLELHATTCQQRTAQLIAFAIFAAEADRIDLADTERDEVVQDGPRRARLAAHVDDIVNRQPGFDGDLLSRRIDLQITVEAEVADDGDAQARIARADFLEAGEVHARRRCSKL